MVLFPEVKKFRNYILPADLLQDQSVKQSRYHQEKLLLQYFSFLYSLKIHNIVKRGGHSLSFYLVQII